MAGRRIIRRAALAAIPGKLGLTSGLWVGVCSLPSGERQAPAAVFLKSPAIDEWDRCENGLLPATMGHVTVSPASALLPGWQASHFFEVELLHGELYSYDREACNAGRNRAIVNGEVLSFSIATQLDAHKYRCTDLYRWREPKIIGLEAGDDFLLLDRAATFINWGAGQTIEVCARCSGEPIGAGLSRECQIP